jgi:hypothetical protein
VDGGAEAGPGHSEEGGAFLAAINQPAILQWKI